MLGVASRAIASLKEEPVHLDVIKGSSRRELSKLEVCGFGEDDVMLASSA